MTLLIPPSWCLIGALTLSQAEVYCQHTLDPSMNSPARIPPQSQADIFERLYAAGQDGLVRALERIAGGEAKTLLVCEGVSLTDDPVLEYSILDFLQAHDAELVRVPIKN